MNKRLFFLLSTFGLTTGLFAQENFEMGNPSKADYGYLNNYGNLKDYINYNKYPNFKLAVGTNATDYNSKGTVYKMTNANFTEVVTGNAMKMSSCVGNGGTMNFNTVKQFVNNATTAGLNIYGHTLAWHSQQSIGWLSSLLKDKEVDDGSAPAYKTLMTKDYTQDNTIGWHSDFTQYNYNITFDATNGMKVTNTKKAAQNYYVQYVAVNNVATAQGKTAKMIMTIKGSSAGSIFAKLGDWNSGPTATIKFTTTWQDVEVTFNNTNNGSFLLLQSGNFVGDIYIKKIEFQTLQGKTVPLSAQEVHDTLVYAMDKWIHGIMNACEGKVKAWDVVNEAISGGGNDGQGNYILQHRDGYVAGSNTWDVGGSAFYWQDYMGDLEYVRQAVRLARKYGPEDIKLFINDYNLESDWDSNKKLKSLINWIKKWEADGITYIDGIGTQMHISYYEKASTQTNKRNAITNMFRLLAASGKLVRISEMDMGYVNSSGENVSTSNMTETAHKNMMNFYKWIIQQYLTIIPPAQRWGICQWCATDSPSNSGWRADTPVGIWDLNNYRKHVYAGFCEGLGGENFATGIESISLSPTLSSLHSSPFREGVYNLSGQKVTEGYKGIVIKNGKKYIIK